MMQRSLLEEIDEGQAARFLAPHVTAQLLTQHQHLLQQNSSPRPSPYAMHHHHRSAPSAIPIAYNTSAGFSTAFALGTRESDQGVIEVSKVAQCMDCSPKWI